MSLWRKIAAPTGANANVLIRFVVGGVFLNEGILEFLHPVAQGAGRFAKIGIPHPEFLGPFVGTVETVRARRCERISPLPCS
jgi:putative oxidoreductase